MPELSKEKTTLSRAEFLKYSSLGLVSLAVAGNTTTARSESQHNRKLETLIFGSCNSQHATEGTQWRQILREDPDVMVLLGDNVYGDTHDMDHLRAQYQLLAEQPGFAELRRRVPLFGIWDDHDYGMNDSGAEYAEKEASRRILLEFFAEPQNSPRWLQDGGIYTSYEFGEDPTQKVRLILLDSRWDRTPLTRVSKDEARRREARNLGPYIPTQDPAARLLGESQWLWLEEQLQKEAALTIVGSSIQVLSGVTGWESWANFPRERQKLLRLVDRAASNRVVFLSGDTHWAEVMRFPYHGRLGKKTFWEMTSSGLTNSWSQISPNPYRIGPATHTPNHGVLSIDWSRKPRLLTMSIRDRFGSTLLRQRLEF